MIDKKRQNPYHSHIDSYSNAVPEKTNFIQPTIVKKVHGKDSELEILLQKAVSRMLAEFRTSRIENQKDRFIDEVYTAETNFSDILNTSVKGWYDGKINVNRFQGASAIPYVRMHEQQHMINDYYGLPQDESIVDQSTRYKIGYAYPDRFRT